MQPRASKLLYDIRTAATFITDATQGITFDDYTTNAMLRFAVERNFEIIGEAVARLVRLDPSMEARIIDFAQLISFRNVLIHGYDLVDHARVWKVITGHLPVLVTDVVAMLEDENS